MHSKLKKAAFATALAVGMNTAGLAPAIAMGAPQDDHHDRDRDRDRAQQRDYSNSEYYKTGYREGMEDRRHHKQRERHDHDYRSDEDRQAHDYGYQTGWGSNHQDRDDHHDEQPH